MKKLWQFAEKNIITKKNEKKFREVQISLQNQVNSKKKLSRPQMSEFPCKSKCRAKKSRQARKEMKTDVTEVNFSKKFFWVIEDHSHQKWVMKKKRLGIAALL